MNRLAHHLRNYIQQISFSDMPRNTHGLVDQLRRKTSKHRRAVAVVGSIFLHGLFLLVLLPSSPRGFSGGGSNGSAYGTGTGGTFTAVDLYATAPALTAETAIKAPKDPVLDALTKPAEAFAPTPEKLILVETMPQLTETNEATVPVVAGSRAEMAAATTGLGRTGTTSGAGDDLWAAISPCWKRISSEDTLKVSLKITFAADGGLAKPPEIVRADGASITPQSLKSEALALAALTQCGAYPMAAGRQEVEVQFPKAD